MLSWRQTSLLLVLFLAFNLSAQEGESADANGAATLETTDSEPIDYSVNFTIEKGQELPRSDTSKRYHGEIEKVLSGDDFARKETVERWRFKDLDEQEKEQRREKYPDWYIEFIEALESGDSNLITISRGFEFILWALLIGLIVFFVLRYREQLGGFISGFGAEPSAPDLPSSMFGLDIKKESIPLDVVQAARKSWADQQPREAVVILLRSSLIKLLHEHNCRFFDSDTEAECCDRIDQQAPQKVAVYMRSLVSAWQSIAYAHVAPSDAVFDQLCRQWSEVF